MGIRSAAVATEPGAGERSDSDESRIILEHMGEERRPPERKKGEGDGAVSMVGGSTINYGGTGGSGSSAFLRLTKCQGDGEGWELETWETDKKKTRG